jgi:hypothetical protein
MCLISEHWSSRKFVIMKLFLKFEKCRHWSSKPVALIWGYKYKWRENIRITGLKVWLVGSFII